AQSVVTNCNVVSSARGYAVEVDRTLQEFESFRIKFHLQENRPQIESQITLFADRQIGIPHLHDRFVQLLLLKGGHVRQTFLQSRQAIPESPVVPTTQSQEGKDLIHS